MAWIRIKIGRQGKRSLRSMKGKQTYRHFHGQRLASPNTVFIKWRSGEDSVTAMAAELGATAAMAGAAGTQPYLPQLSPFLCQYRVQTCKGHLRAHVVPNRYVGESKRKGHNKDSRFRKTLPLLPRGWKLITSLEKQTSEQTALWFCDAASFEADSVAALPHLPVLTFVFLQMLTPSPFQCPWVLVSQPLGGLLRPPQLGNAEAFIPLGETLGSYPGLSLSTFSPILPGMTSQIKTACIYILVSMSASGEKQTRTEFGRSGNVLYFIHCVDCVVFVFLK